MIEKDKLEALKKVQKDYEEATEEERRNMNDLKGVIRNEELANGLNPVIVGGLERLKEMMSG